ncbi:MAG: chaperonin cofactor prefoldin [Marinoscillum sp.]|jgi:chaperonin cofactor prefoldin
MSNDTLRTEINNLERKIKLLLNEYTQMRSELERIGVENAQLKAQTNSQEASLESFQNQTKISKIVGSMAVGESDAGELKEVLDEYIKEIDKCIAHLSEA